MAKRPTNPPEVWDSGWDLNTPPVEGAVLTDRGWEIPLKGTDPADGLTELIVAIGQGDATTEAAEANIVGVGFEDTDLAQGDTVAVLVTFNENVDVTAGATINITSTGVSGDFVATAAEQLGENVIRFEATVPSETADLTIDAQTISGTIVDAGTAVASELVVEAGDILDQTIEIA